MIIHAWVIMSNHLHMIISRKEDGEQLSDIVRDFKKYTSTTILKAVKENKHESRRNWMLWIFESVGSKNENNKKYQFWRQDSHPEQLISNKFMDQKVDYIHNNPVAARIVDEPENYVYSSAKDYANQQGLLDIEMIL
ncbi:transposase [Reichenbachiella versicolor]|uniref:transposase n=1 Tax=Reichenbachiella versicolor TaxID=1821036 RepID=UPI002937460C|nr:transposase [Reichenbachiella versicolor]